MQFYLNNVLCIRREDEPEEGISADIIGNIFHDTAEFFYEWLQQRYGTDTITADMLCDKTFAIREAIQRTLQLMLHTAFDVSWFHPTEEFDRLPETGDSFDYNGLRVTVQAVEHRRILKLRISRIPEEAPEGGDAP